MISSLADPDQAEWDSFVAGHAEATACHLSVWSRIVADGLNATPRFLVKRRDGCIAGVLPLAECRGTQSGHALISLPVLPYGGVLAEDFPTARALIEAAMAMRDRAGAAMLELRFRAAPPTALMTGEWQPAAPPQLSFRRTIAGDDEANRRALPKPLRAALQDAREIGHVAIHDQDTDTLHRVLARAAAAGAPVSRRALRLIVEGFGEAAVVTTIRAGDAVRAAALSLLWRGEALVLFGAALPDAAGERGNEVLYWETIRMAAARGCRMFDFGRSNPGSAGTTFRQRFGFVGVTLGWSQSTPAGGACS